MVLLKSEEKLRHKTDVAVQNKCETLKQLTKGNVNMVEKGSPGGLVWYKGLCDPIGRTPCCYSNHTCVSLSEAQCQCAGCQDLRQQIHAELSTWKPHDPDCQPQQFHGEPDICPLLHNLTIHVVGDSFMRQVFMSMVGTLRSGYPDGLIKDVSIPREYRPGASQPIMLGVQSPFPGVSNNTCGTDFSYSDDTQLA
ncbi:hypothetical protein PoB_007616900 [Plakobranchus ocellatus]|uniref:Uncharacterized protein n=1 Tax=Plakobranchus ocellatus TaxID=259542 RepID=A0AAV4E006_9GAST|nr:hypothetical protein PoB_007616900 [Plakobranchus ocellatus]